MLIYHRSSLLESKAQTLVNTVNTIGVMGKGLAQEFKHRYPTMFQQYKRICEEGLLDIGKLWLWKGSSQWVLNFPTKRHWRYPSKVDFIERGLEKFCAEYENRGIREIAFPRLGCGNGGLEWDEIRPLMERYLARLPITVYIHDHSVDSPLPEHLITSSEEGGASFHSFICDLRDIARQANGDLQTLHNAKKFKIEFGLDNSVLISTEKARHAINDLDLFELWALLQKGPVGVQRMVGSAKNSGYYLLPLLGKLPYIRVVNVSSGREAGATAVELVRLPADTLRAA
ncbi:MAG: macro domain-containing protein [Sphingomonas sp.]|nr:macro domain-containing protein [Sphingomonas sp.]